MKQITNALCGLFFLGIVFIFNSSFHSPSEGEAIDYLNGVPIYYNGNINKVHGRHWTYDNYNLGLKWQCVEFVKRYYYEVYGHKMPNSYGNAKHFFDKSLAEVAYNPKRGMTQYRNVRYDRPQSGDILVFDGSIDNHYGHIGIISQVTQDSIELAQQNWGTKTRRKIKLAEFEGIYTIADEDVLGWLRLE